MSKTYLCPFNLRSEKTSLYSNEAKIKPTGLRSKGSKLLPINVRVSALVVFTEP